MPVPGSEEQRWASVEGEALTTKGTIKKTAGLLFIIAIYLTLARSLALVAIVIGGLMFMYGEGGAKRQISGIVFGGGLALFAAQFLAWLF